MNEGVRIVQTAAGPLTLTPPRRETFEGLRSVVHELVLIEGGTAEAPEPLLGLLFGIGDEQRFGLRTGYGWFEGGALSDDAIQHHRVGRWLLPHALQAFRARGFEGTLLPASCLWGEPGRPAQVGELQFVHVRGPLRDAKVVASIAGYEKRFGAGASQVLMTFLFDMGAAWALAGVKRRMTDIEPCGHLDPSARWAADLVLVDDRLMLIRPRIDEADPFLAEIVRAEITEVEWAPSTFVLHSAQAPGQAPAPDA